MILEKNLYFKNTPLMKEEWYTSLERTLLSNFAPKWNTIIGDRITDEDYSLVKNFESMLYENRDFMEEKPNEKIFNFIRRLKFHSFYFYSTLNGLDIEKDFYRIPFMTREDLQNKITELFPADIDLDRLIVNPTSGTTGKPILAPNHPYAIGCYVPLTEYTLFRYGIIHAHDHNITSGIQLCHQNKTIVYATSHSLAAGAKFVKINLKPNDWKSESSIDFFISEQSPIFFSGDPYSFEQAMKTGLNYKPKAILSTAIELEESLRLALVNHFKCPVINSYSLNETGPIAYSCPLDPEWLHILPHDIFVETVDLSGENKTFGEIVVTGGRNPFLPLLRYRTGDHGELNFSNCKCGEKSPRLKLLKGRKPISLSDTRGNTINPVDISRILRKYPHILRHQFIQRKGGGYMLNLSYLFSPNEPQMESIKSEFFELLGSDADIQITDSLPNDQSKIMVFINENIPI